MDLDYKWLGSLDVSDLILGSLMLETWIVDLDHRLILEY